MYPHIQRMYLLFDWQKYKKYFIVSDMNRDELLKEIEAIAREVFQKPELVANDAMSAADVDTWTSLSFMQFLTAIEDKYGFKFKMMELLQLRNMGAVVDATMKHIV